MLEPFLNDLIQKLVNGAYSMKTKMVEPYKK